ncbi:MAG: CPBP family intramembrane metalloprotease [Acidobacteria bacterium]|nr:CPBP family intramembrane metalloprotease [Acidobacteriota bacterium]
MTVRLSGYLLLVAVGVLLPLRSWLALRHHPLGAPIDVPKAKRYRVGISLTLLQAAFALWVAVDNRLQPLFGSFRLDAGTVLGTLALLALSLGLLQWMVRHRSPGWRMRFYSILPETGRQRVVWVFICMIVAVAEEVLYRAVLWGLLERLTGDYWIAAVLASLVFALNHLVQGWISTGTIFVIGFGFHLLVHVSGGLYAAVAAHFIYDLCAGLCYSGAARKESLSAESMKTARLATP